MSPVPIDPHSAVAHSTILASETNDRFGALFAALDPAQVGLDDDNVQPGGLHDVSLASPANAVWRTLMEHSGLLSLVGTTPMYAADGGWVASGSAGSPSGLYIPQAADITAGGDLYVADKTTRLRLRVDTACNATAPGVDISWALFPIVDFGGSGPVTPLLGPTVLQSVAGPAAINASTAGRVVGSSFDYSVLTAGTAYVLAVRGSATMDGASAIGCHVTLQVRHT